MLTSLGAGRSSMGTFPAQRHGNKEQAGRNSNLFQLQLREKRNKFFTREDCVNSVFGCSHSTGEEKKGIFVLPYPGGAQSGKLGLFALAGDSLPGRTGEASVGFPVVLERRQSPT